jgi:hypothetical protein
MALTQGSKITATDFNNLKTALKTELARRKYTGSVSSYATNFTVAPAANSNMTA